MATSYYKSKYDRQFTPGQGLPTISTELDSVRAYQFEIHFIGLPDDVTNSTDLTLAATKVTGIEMGNEAIVVNRVNDKVHYPGRIFCKGSKLYTMTPHSTVEVYGVYPSKWSAAEFNYSTNDFHKLDVTFKYDFMNSYNYANPG